MLLLTLTDADAARAYTGRCWEGRREDNHVQVCGHIGAGRGRSGVRLVVVVLTC